MLWQKKPTFKMSLIQASPYASPDDKEPKNYRIVNKYDGNRTDSFDHSKGRMEHRMNSNLRGGIKMHRRKRLLRLKEELIR